MAAMLLALPLLFGPAWADRTPEGVDFVSGGIGDEERSALREAMPRYSLWLTTAARGSGAYLAQVKVSIIDAQDRLWLRHAMQGPWLLVDLPPGRYRVEAQLGDQLRQAVTTIHPGDHHQLVLYFDVADADVLPGDAG